MTAPVPTSPLISAEALRTLLAQSPAPVIVDCSFDLADTDAGERGYRAGHLPGARYAHLERDLSGPKTGADGRFLGRHPLRERADYAALMARWGIAPGTPVVVYDRQGAMFAARLWWTLRWMGHADVRVLDGGVAAWEAAGEPLEAGDGPADQALPPYPAQPPRMPTVQAEPLRDRLAAARVIDARAPERFRGDVEPLDKVAGHIPGARNRFFKNNLQPDGRFKPADQLRAEFAATLDGCPLDSVVHQCGSGATACHNLLAMEVAGFQATTLYPGSWSEWSARGDDFPKEKTPAP